MGFFKNKTHMFSYRADKAEENAQRFEEKGWTRKAEEQRDFAKMQREKAKMYEGQEGW